jgi:hypothetical protein
MYGTAVSSGETGGVEVVGAGALRETARREGLSMQAAALKAVDEYVNRRTARREALLAQILDEDAGLLKRVADA